MRKFFLILVGSILGLTSLLLSDLEGLFWALAAAVCFGGLLSWEGPPSAKCKASFFSYSNVARFWAIVFLITGLAFLFVPDLVGMLLMLIASKVGLTSYLDTLAGSLWYVLALSFMAMISVCAWLSGRAPSNRELYYLLLVAKIVSTLGFLVLSYTQAPAFLLCAIADGFVAVTLAWSGRRG